MKKGDVALAIVKLEGIREFRVLKDYISHRCAGEIALAIKGDEHTEVARGRAQTWMELEDLLNNSADMADRLENKNGKTIKGQPRYPGSS